MLESLQSALPLQALALVALFVAGFMLVYSRYTRKLKSEIDHARISAGIENIAMAGSGEPRDSNGSSTWLPDSIVVLDRQLRIVWANDTANTWFGIKIPEDSGKALFARVPGVDIERFIKAGDYRGFIDIDVPRSDQITARVRVVPYRSGQFLFQARDVTRIKQLEQVRRDFVANASHELRTPISVLYGYLEMMQQEGSQGISAEWQPAIQQMNLQATRIRRIVDDMLTLSRLEDVDTGDKHEWVDLCSLLELACENAKAISAERQHRFETDFDAGTRLLCSARDIESLVSNLLSNAIRYTPDRGLIKVSWAVNSVGGTLLVADNGMGIEPAEVGRITERFFRTEEARRSVPAGTGLGLAIVNHVVHRHDAALDIDSEVGQGSRFTVRFPLSRVRSPADPVSLLLN